MPYIPGLEALGGDRYDSCWAICTQLADLKTKASREDSEGNQARKDLFKFVDMLEKEDLWVYLMQFRIPGGSHQSV
jgi:hypothetical protein